MSKKKVKAPVDFMNADLDDLDSSEDDDYVPDAKTLLVSEKELTK